MKKYLLFIACLFMITGCSNDLFEKSTDKDEILISAATSLTEVMEDIVSAYKDVDPSTEITLNFGGSGKLAQQIQQGAPADIFLSADQKWMDMLDEQELITSDTRTNFAVNRLVLIGKENSPLAIDSLNELSSKPIDQIAIGNPDSVPAGSYAKEALESNGIWGPGSPLQDKFVYGKDVHQVLTYVQSGNTDIGFVYASDVQGGNGVKVLLEIDDTLHEEIVYPAAVTSYSLNKKKSNDFISFLKSDEAVSIFEAYGFKK